MKDGLRAVAREFRAGATWPECSPIYGYQAHLFPQTPRSRARRAFLWASYEARERLARWIDPGPVPPADIVLAPKRETRT